MRPLRFLITLLTFILAFLLLLFAGPWTSGTSTTQDITERSSFGTYFNWRASSSLFPPSAVISITDDNSTNFLARPAAFGPLLPAKSLSGQLWIGSGFGDDHRGRGDGELGCSDVPGWDHGSWSAGVSGKKASMDLKTLQDDPDSPLGNSKRGLAKDEDDDETGPAQPAQDDGTDDYLHHPLLASGGAGGNAEAAGTSRKPAHADIQSLQESAEIAGKVVLLSRGGCGFLEKVKWVQRRGGIALIVGDDNRGGPLVTMYARGDTSNVTIPSLFTSHTTAQLLSSLMPSGALVGSRHKASQPALEGKAKAVVEGQGGQRNHDADKPNFTTTSIATKATPTPKSSPKDGKHKASENEIAQPRRGWLASMFGGGSEGTHDNRRPPSSGKIGWVLQEEFDDEEYSRGKPAKQSSNAVASSAVSSPDSRKGESDGFQIGVQDWRDPDLVAEQKEQLLRGSSTTSSSSAAVAKSSHAVPTSFKGGSITPGSGSYGKAHHGVVDMSGTKKSQSKGAATSHDIGSQQVSSRGWFGRLFHSSPGHSAKAESGAPKAGHKLDTHGTKGSGHDHHQHSAGVPPLREGLWVTLSPASMSTSPFFDTLLVLVVSPLVTLTVVYALLLLRSRIRRRRWRAPKSVVERLPVRTYQTMSSGTSSSTSSVSSPVTATTPLLPTASRPISTRPRPRARTTSEVPGESSIRSDGMASPSLEQIEEKRAAGLAEWRRRYGGKQRECVVCLEEYVDGVSRVMSLPCGHEFHAECITPWLTTRRRTCPICKGDVVRTLARSGGTASTPSPPAQQQQQQQQQHFYDQDSDPDDDDDDQDVQDQVVATVNDDPASQQPVSREDEAFEDLERGVAPDRTR